jgi:hypothetical protein
MITTTKSDLKTAIFNAADTLNENTNWTSLPQIVDTTLEHFNPGKYETVFELRDAIETATRKAFAQHGYLKNAFNEERFVAAIVNLVSAISFARELNKRGGI